MDADEMYSAGRRLEDRGRVDDLPAIEQWYRKAAAAGSTEAMGRLGLLMEGRTRAKMEDRCQYVGDFAEAARWYRQAAEMGNFWAAFALGRLYADKLDDWGAAEPWLRKAAADGWWQAKERLAEGPAGVIQRKRRDAFVDQLQRSQQGDRESPDPSPGTAAPPGGCLMVVAIIGVLPVLFIVLMVVSERVA